MLSSRAFISVSALCLILTSCATMSPKECQIANWHELGQSDGLNGKTLTFFNERKSDCAEANILPDTKTYLTGRERGLKSYCQISNAAQLGLRGEAYEGVCPPAIDQEFRRRHRIGFDIYHFRAEINQLEYRFESLNRQYHKNQHEFEHRLNSQGRNEDHRHLYREFEHEQQRIRGQQSEIDRTLQWTRDQLRNAEMTLDNLR